MSYNFTCLWGWNLEQTFDFYLSHFVSCFKCSYMFNCRTSHLQFTGQPVTSARLFPVSALWEFILLKCFLLILCFSFRISRLFSDAKKILLYSQNDKNLDGFKELTQALQALQQSRSGRKASVQPSADTTTCWVSLNFLFPQQLQLHSQEINANNNQKYFLYHNRSACMSRY